ncbi:class I SAM-dependent methyltransferase [Bauldia litoralis]|uniref:Methyltransferase domain-containing protein n=1 Tax=Bauldia litoralis TaxID=665467 RepID=A0A1G6CVQ2_9HYPH|nr:class I SAM-dependent methyltransferase [Bauldia litoralis]SDB36959.1 Methyltransferase domain-containing protein [Bauldia litoralis]
MASDLPYPLALRREHVQGARLYATRDDALESLPAGGHVAEIGVAYGDFSERLCGVLAPKLFDAFDLFQLHKVEVIWGRPLIETFQGRSHRAFYEERCADRIAAGRMRLFEGDSSALMARSCPDQFYDVIYIDGAHSYDGVRRDTEAALAKIKRHGYLIFNDYIMADLTGNSPYGVVQVVNELCVSSDWRVHYLALQASMFCDNCLVRRC